MNQLINTYKNIYYIEPCSFKKWSNDRVMYSRLSL